MKKLFNIASDHDTVKYKTDKLMTFKIPRIIAHKGASGYAPENTLEAIYTASDMGAEWVHLDVRLTKDDVPVIFCDEDLSRTTNGSGALAGKTWDDLAQLEAGSWFGDSFSGTQIPSLEQALEAVIDLDIGLNIDLKPENGQEAHMTEAALDIVSQLWDSKNFLVSSSNPACIDTAIDIAPDYKRSWVLEQYWPENWEELATHLELTFISVHANYIKREDIEKIIDFGLPVMAYTVNQPDLVRQLQGWGMDGFFTDYPDIVQDSLFTIH